MSRKRLGMLLGMVVVASGAAWKWWPEEEHRSPKGPLLTRAIDALGGRELLGGIRSLQTRVEAVERGHRLMADISLELPGRYRHDSDIGDGQMVHATDGDASWALLDRVPVTLGPEEIRGLREQTIISRLSLLVGLEGDKDVKVRELAEEEGLEWLEVEFTGMSLGPYRLGFDAKTSLLKKAHYETRFHGERKDVPVVLSLGDYKKVSGLMVPFAADLTRDGKPFASSRVLRLVVNPEFPKGFFQAPPATDRPPVLRRTIGQRTVALLEVTDQDAEDAEQVLTSFIAEHRVIRNGPSFRVVDDEETRAVGLPVEPGPSDLRPVSAKGTPRLAPWPASDVLTIIVKDPDQARLRSAHRRLTERASELGLASAGPYRHVTWTRDITQIQLPVATKSEGQRK